MWRTRDQPYCDMDQNDGNRRKDQRLFLSKYFFLPRCPFYLQSSLKRRESLGGSETWCLLTQTSFLSQLAKNSTPKRERELGGSVWSFPSARSSRICLGLELGGLGDDVLKHEPGLGTRNPFLSAKPNLDQWMTFGSYLNSQGYGFLICFQNPALKIITHVYLSDIQCVYSIYMGSK